MLNTFPYFLLGIAFLLFSCKKINNTPEDFALGEIYDQFPVSSEAKNEFNKGLLLLHSFEYDDAKVAFLAAQDIDSTEVMAYWGEAMCNYKALWGLQDVPAGREVMGKLGATSEERLSKAEAGLEKEFWKGVEILFGDGELKARNEKYISHMKQLYNTNPNDLEVAAFYSLGLMWADYDNREYLDKSSEIALNILKENPTHPGALHYMIHSNDDPQYAQLARSAADEYAKVAPDAAHALHMPSHIYVALGMWNEVVSSNIASYQASLRRVEKKALHGSERGYHSMAWLHYGYLQQGNYDEAAILLKEMISYHKDSTASDAYTITMQNQQRIEAGKWIDDMEPINVNYKKLGLGSKSQKHFFRSLLAFDENNSESIKEEIDTLHSQLETAKLFVGDDGIVLCSAGPTRFAPSQEGINKSYAVIHQMEALIAMLHNDDKTAEEHLIEATTMEANEKYDSGPPFISYPSFEQYGDWLLTKKRAEDALLQFNRSLESRTNRSKALRGKIKALKMLGRVKEAAEVQDVLDGFWKTDGFSSS